MISQKSKVARKPPARYVCASVPAAGRGRADDRPAKYIIRRPRTARPADMEQLVLFAFGDVWPMTGREMVQNNARYLPSAKPVRYLCMEQKRRMASLLRSSKGISAPNYLSTNISHSIDRISYYLWWLLWEMWRH